jgi:hypothetical protein
VECLRDPLRPQQELNHPLVHPKLAPHETRLGLRVRDGAAQRLKGLDRFRVVFEGFPVISLPFSNPPELRMGSLKRVLPPTQPGRFDNGRFQRSLGLFFAVQIQLTEAEMEQGRRQGMLFIVLPIVFHSALQILVRLLMIFQRKVNRTDVRIEGPVEGLVSMSPRDFEYLLV